MPEANATTTRSRSVDPSSVHPGPILAALLLGAFVTILNQTLLNVAIPRLMSDFSASAATVQWLSTAYMLTNGVLIPISAFLIARFSTRHLFISAMVLFTAGSIICSIANSFSIMLVGRVVQAFGAGIIMPLMMTVVLNLFPPASRGKAMGTIGIAMIFAPAIGPTLSGWIIQNYSWRILFWIVIPFAVIDIILAMAVLKNVTERSNPRFDMSGFVTSTIGFGFLLYGFSEAGNKSWGDPVVTISLIVGVVFLALFCWRELVAREPMLNLKVFRYDMLSLTTVVSSIINIAMFGAMILLPIYLQNIRGFSPLEAGLLLMPGSILMGIMSPISGALFDRIGARPLVIIGLVITAITTYQFTKLTTTTTYGHIMLLYTFRMFGMGFIMMTIMTAGLNQLPRSLNAHGTAAANTARTVAGSLGTAILVSIMTNSSHGHMARLTDQMSVFDPSLMTNVHQMGAGIAAQLGVSQNVGFGAAVQMLMGKTLQQATIQGINDAFMFATVVTIVALALSFFIRRVTPPGMPKAEKTAKKQASTAAPATR